ncbi:DUF1302 family protein [Neptuniibacter sp.]|uniref:DUF1302 family protein n=1 Tax=Neptuniibacter sp. TaxID=1962643 RepID=UPI00260D58C7|nr:DUF1302 family protein [Neptuniibacter sp.]MCP4596775.1 DUF1302 domain-containing protein [Neptuniibacter sp.]
MTKKITTLNKVAVAVAMGIASSYGPAVLAGETEWSGFVENATYHRESKGISKSRNTAQLEFSRNLISSDSGWDNVSVHGTLRATYDAVYDINDDEFGAGAGAQAGQDIFLETTLNGVGTPVAHGSGLNAATVDGAYGLLNADPANIGTAGGFPFVSAFTNGYPNNPSTGMKVLGEDTHKINGGVAFGVPVRPCDVDSRGCIKDYIDADENDLKYPEFNDRWDFLREFYIDATRTLDDGDQLNVRLGRQQVVWGRTDLFRVLDVLNPVDYSRHNIYDELEDTRIPMWMLQMERRMGPTGGFDDLNASVVWNFDKFRPHNLGSCSGAYNPLDAACFFRGMKNLWDNGGTVANFAPINAAGLPAGLAPILAPQLNAVGALPDEALAAASDPTIAGWAATNFGPNQIGIRDVHLPSWSLSNTQLGAKLEGVYGDLNFSVNALTYRSQFPSLRGGKTVDNSENPFVKGDVGPTPHLIAFDIYFPRVNLIGGSLDYYSESLDTVFRFEGAYSQGEEFADSMSEDLFSDSDVLRYVIGVDKTVMIPALNRSRGFLFSGQLFGEHLLDHRSEQATYGERGFAQWKSNNIATLLIKGWWMNDRLSPQIIMAHDFRAQSSVAAPMVEWLINDNWKLTASANIKFGDGADKTADDCRSCNPYGPFTAYPAAEHGAGVTSGSAGLASLEPTGRFRSGILGMANEEDEYQITVQYRF